MVFCFFFIVNCAKPDAPIKGPKHVFNIGTYRPVKMCMCSGFLLTGCCLDDKQSPFIYKYNLSQKALSTLNIYKIVIRLKSQVLSKEDSRLVADRQTCYQLFFFCSSSNPLEHWIDALTTWVTSLVQSHHHIFSLCWPIWIALTWGRLWKSYV